MITRTRNWSTQTSSPIRFVVSLLYCMWRCEEDGIFHVRPMSSRRITTHNNDAITLHARPVRITRQGLFQTRVQIQARFWHSLSQPQNTLYFMSDPSLSCPFAENFPFCSVFRSQLRLFQDLWPPARSSFRPCRKSDRFFWISWSIFLPSVTSACHLRLKFGLVCLADGFPSCPSKSPFFSFERFLLRLSWLNTRDSGLMYCIKITSWCM